MGGKLLRMAWGRYQNRQAGQQGAFAAAAAAAAATAGMGSMPGMGLMLEQQTAGYLLPPGMLGAPPWHAVLRRLTRALAKSRSCSSLHSPRYLLFRKSQSDQATESPEYVSSQCWNTPGGLATVGNMMLLLQRSHQG